MLSEHTFSTKGVKSKYKFDGQNMSYTRSLRAMHRITCRDLMQRENEPVRTQIAI